MEPVKAFRQLVRISFGLTVAVGLAHLASREWPLPVPARVEPLGSAALSVATLLYGVWAVLFLPRWAWELRRRSGSPDTERLDDGTWRLVLAGAAVYLGAWALGATGVTTRLALAS